MMNNEIEKICPYCCEGKMIEDIDAYGVSSNPQYHLSCSECGFRVLNGYLDRLINQQQELKKTKIKLGKLLDNYSNLLTRRDELWKENEKLKEELIQKET